MRERLPMALWTMRPADGIGELPGKTEKKLTRVNRTSSLGGTGKSYQPAGFFGLPFSGCEGRGLRIECEGVEHVAWVQNHDALPGHLNCMHEGRVQIDESTTDLIGHIADGVR